jgi:hypothetical protein
MFFTPLYGVRNTGCPQISKKNYPKLEKTIIKKNIFLGVIDPPEAFFCTSKCSILLLNDIN